MNVAYLYHGSTEVLVAGCIDCHTENEAHQITEEFQVEIHMYLDSLGSMLMNMNILSEAGYLLGQDGENNASSDNPAVLEADVMGAFFNYKMIEEDRSGGVHNPKYAKALLVNSIEALQSK